MWSEKQRKYQKNIYSKLMLAILLLASVITLTACRSSNIKETTKQTDHKTKKWEPLLLCNRIFANPPELFCCNNVIVVGFPAFVFS